jgi:hypothetical protein
VHIYTAVGFSYVPILLSLFQLIESNGASIIKECIMTSLNWNGGLVDNAVANRLVCLGANGGDGPVWVPPTGPGLEG